MSKGLSKVRAFLIIGVGVFIAAAGPVFLLNLTNIWTIPLSTWQTILTAGVAGVVTWLMAVVAPVAIKPSAGLRFPEA
jgi:hypothetical protein